MQPGANHVALWLVATLCLGWLLALIASLGGWFGLGVASGLWSAIAGASLWTKLPPAWPALGKVPVAAGFSLLVLGLIAGETVAMWLIVVNGLSGNGD